MTGFGGSIGTGRHGPPAGEVFVVLMAMTPADDGYCAQVVVDWRRGGLIDTDFSPLACPEGDADCFSMVPGDSGVDTWASSMTITLRKTR